MKARVLRIAIPCGVLLFFLGLWRSWPALAPSLGLDPAASARWIALLCWLAVARLTTRLLHVLVWEGTVARRTGVPAPQLLTVLTDLVIWLSVGIVILAVPFHEPVGAFLTTSGVAFALAGLAGRSLLSDAVSGIAITFDRSFALRDFVSVGGMTGKVVRISWRATTLLQPNGVLVTISNSRMAEATLLLYRVWREQIDIDLGYEVSPELADRMLIAAAREVVPPIPGRDPVAWIAGFAPGAVKWQLVYWYSDYGTSLRLRSDVRRAILRNLHFVGHRPAILRQHIDLGGEASATISESPDASIFLGKVPLFKTLTGPERKQLAAVCVARTVPAGGLVVREGETGESLFLIREGLFDVLLGDNETPVARLASGELFGEMSLLTGSPRTATVRAAADSVVVEITKDALLPIIGQRETLAEQLSAVLDERQKRNDALSLSMQARETPGRPDAKNYLLSRIREFFGLPPGP